MSSQEKIILKDLSEEEIENHKKQIKKRIEEARKNTLKLTVKIIPGASLTINKTED